MVAGLGDYCGVEVRFLPLAMKVQNFIFIFGAILALLCDNLIWLSARERLG